MVVAKWTFAVWFHVINISLIVISSKPNDIATEPGLKVDELGTVTEELAKEDVVEDGHADDNTCQVHQLKKMK